ncbi:hypothetical protein RHSIM_Rhsim04G0239700 [Rhododendron simsii]|uniref:BI1-like protein n=1 Tax=Rhododendron simsii TaxID=118357 RepID=A0A834H317_RHOSS|nr:hypothetical protein RHSIM_Rhsim04G0239700 [Rhododendron simsii]
MNLQVKTKNHACSCPGADLVFWILSSAFVSWGFFFPGTTRVLRGVVLLAGILTSIVVISSTLYMFWSTKNGCDFHFLGPFLFTSLLVLIAFALIQVFMPMGKLGSTVYKGLAPILFSAFIAEGTDNLIKRFNYDEYIWAAISLYLDILNLFLALLRR